MLGLLTLLGAGLVLFLGGLTWITARSLIRPPRRTYAWAVANNRPGDPNELDKPRPFESWTFTSGGIEFAVWEITGDAPDGPTLVCSHGWSDSMIGALGRMHGLAASASRVITWDMRGHGESPGVCQHGTGEVNDLLKLIERIGEPVVLYGWSLGAGISIAAAARLATGAENQTNARVLGVIAEAPYRMPKTPARAVIRSMNMPCTITLDMAFWLLGIRFGVGPTWQRGQAGMGFDRATLATKLTCPLLVLHGDQDTIAPFDDGKAIAKAAGERARLVTFKGANHNGVWADPTLAAHEITTFIASLD